MTTGAIDKPQSRFQFPYPTETQKQLCNAIVWLMMDGKRRSILEIQAALGTGKEIGARVRWLRTPEGGAWPFNDARSDGPDEDGVFRYVLKQRPARVVEE
jgi:hypothetical protein